MAQQSLYEAKYFKPTKGMSQDTKPINQPDDKYRFALNAIVTDEQGSFYTMSNEQGTQAVHVLREGHVIIGSIVLSNERVAIFSTDGLSSHSIGIMNGLDYTEVLHDIQLNFSKDHHITGVHRTINGCDDVIYFRDSYNPDRRINLSKIDDGVYTPFDANDIQLNPDYVVPNITCTAGSQGSLEPGAYQVGIAYLDDSYSVVYRSYLSLPAYVVKDEHDSVEVYLSNLDTRFAYMTIYVVAATTGDGRTVRAFEYIRNKPIQSTSTSLTVTNITSDMPEVSIPEITQRNVIYETSRAMEQVQGRLLRGGLTEKKRNFVAMQQLANQINVKWVAQVVTREERQRTFISDEWQSFAVVYVFKDGSESPAFHIPARTSFSIDAQPISGYYMSGDPESARGGDLTYNNPRCADGMWGSLAGTTVTSFKTPSRSIIPIALPDFPVYPSKKVRIGFNFSNVQYPPEAVGHYIVKARRDSTNRIVHSKAYSQRLSKVYDTDTETNITAATVINKRDYGARTATKVVLYSPFVYYNRRAPEATHYSWDKEYYPLHYYLDSSSTDPSTSSWSGVGNDSIMRYDGKGWFASATDIDVGIGAMYTSMSTVNIDSPKNTFVIDDIKYFHPQDKSTQWADAQLDDVYINPSLTIPACYINSSLLDPYQDTAGIDNLYYTTLYYNDRVVLNDLYSIEYIRMHDGVLTGAATLFYGDHWITEMSILNIFLSKKGGGSILEAFGRIAVAGIKGAAAVGGSMLGSGKPKEISEGLANAMQSMGAVGTTAPQAAAVALAAGAAIGVISKTAEIIKLYQNKGLEKATAIEVIAPSQISSGINAKNYDALYVAEHTRGLIIESEIELTLRTKDNVCGEVFDSYDGDLQSYVRDRLMTKPVEEKHYIVNDAVCPEIYEYNYDYSKQNVENVYFPVSQTYDYCSECEFEYPERIIWSSVSPAMNVGQGDNYTIYLPLNARDMPANRGPITAIVDQLDKVLVQARDTSWVLQAGPSVIQANVNNVYLGTGDFLSLQEQELSISEIGSAGNPSGRFLKTPLGVVWCDTNNGLVYRYGSKMQDLSSLEFGMSSFFSNNINSKADVLFTYDPTFNSRFIMAHKYADDSAYEEQGKGRDWSFTISFSDINQSWVSFHSYIPDFLFYTQSEMFSSKGNTIYRHNVEGSSTMYDKSYKHVIEYVVKSQVTSELHAINYHQNTVARINNEEVQDTYTSYIVYNDTQSTGRCSIVLGTPSSFIQTWDNTLKYAIKTDENIKLNSFRDISTSDIVVSKQWADIINEFYTDKVFINTNSNYPEWQLQDIKGKFFLIRFEYEGVYRIYTEWFLNTIKKSIR